MVVRKPSQPLVWGRTTSAKKRRGIPVSVLRPFVGVSWLAGFMALQPATQCVPLTYRNPVAGGAWQEFSEQRADVSRCLLALPKLYDLQAVAALLRWTGLDGCYATYIRSSEWQPQQ